MSKTYRKHTIKDPKRKPLIDLSRKQARLKARAELRKERPS